MSVDKNCPILVPYDTQAIFTVVVCTRGLNITGTHRESITLSCISLDNPS